MRIFQCEDGVYCIFCDKHEDDNYVNHGNSDNSCPDFIEEKEVIK